MRSSYIIAILAFVLAVCAIAFLSIPDETTRVALLLDNNQLEHAEKLLREQYAREPDNLEVASKLVKTMLALKERPEAKAIVQTVLRNHPDNIHWKRKLAYIFLDEKDPRAAENALLPQERDSAFWKDLAQAYHDISLEESAEKAIFEAYAKDTDKGGLWRTLAKWRSERNNIQGEKEALCEALKIAPEDKELISSYFRNRAKAGDLKGALSVAQKLPQPLEREYLESLYGLYYANGNYHAAKAVLDELLSRKDAVPSDTLAKASILYLEKDYAGSLDLLNKLARHADDFPLQLKEAIASQSRAVRMALSVESAKKGDEQPLLAELAEAAAAKSQSDPEYLRNLLYACLHLSDFHGALSKNKNGDTKDEVRKDAAKRAQFWLEKAQAIYDQNRDALPLADQANSYLAADLAERGSDWAGMLNAWKALENKDHPDFRTLLGVAGAFQHLNDYENSWKNLLKAEKLVSNDADLRTLALQAQAAASSLPSNHAQRRQRLIYAGGLARKSLAREWNSDLALNLFFQTLEINDLDEADRLLSSLESRGLATPADYLGLAEAQISIGSHPGKTRHRVVSGQADRNARKALPGLAPEELPRLLHVFMVLGDKESVGKTINRIERENVPQSPAVLSELAEAYNFLGDKNKQAAFLEKRARLTGKLADWKEAIDIRYWNGDPEGALALLDSADSVFPINGELAGRRVMILADLGHYDRAIKSFQADLDQDQEIVKKMPAESLAALAEAYDKRGHPDRSRHFYNLVLTHQPGNNRALSGLADLARRDGRQADAVRLLREFIDRNPDNIWARAELAGLSPLHEKRQYKNILASRQNPDGREKAVRAMALWKTGKLKQAIKIYSDLMKEPNRDVAVMCDYAQALMDAGRFEDAKGVLQQAVHEFPNDMRSHWLLGTVFIRKKEYAQAENALRKALSLAPRNKGVMRDLAYVQQAQKKFWSAQQNYLHGGKR